MLSTCFFLFAIIAVDKKYNNKLYVENVEEVEDSIALTLTENERQARTWGCGWSGYDTVNLVIEKLNKKFPSYIFIRDDTYNIL